MKNCFKDWSQSRFYIAFNIIFQSYSYSLLLGLSLERKKDFFQECNLDRSGPYLYSNYLQRLSVCTSSQAKGTIKVHFAVEWILNASKT